MTKSPLKIMTYIIQILVFPVLPILFLAGGLYFWFFLDSSPMNPGNGNIEIVVQPGMGLNELASELKQLNLIDNPDYFIWRYRIEARLGLAGHYQAGRYNLPPNLKTSKLIHSLTEPDATSRVYSKITIPPGITSSQIASIMQKSGLTEITFVVQAIQDLAGDFPILQTTWGLQGYLFPDTYKIETFSGDRVPDMKKNAEMMIKLMANRFFQVLNDIEPSWKKFTLTQLHEKVILASIVEREYRVSEEAPRIAAVFNNRINKGMLLQSCATVAYVIEYTEPGYPYRKNYLNYNRRIFEHHLEISSPFNTYLYSGLPPAPIAISGRTALQAALRPENVDFLYFVVKDPTKGTHVFSNKYAEHLNARKVYLNQYVVKE